MVGLGVMPILALLNLIKDNRRGLVGTYVVMIGGLVLLGGATLLLDRGLIAGRAWLVLVGVARI